MRATEGKRSHIESAIEFQVAIISNMARIDTVSGGAGAMVEAKRRDEDKSANPLPDWIGSWVDIVIDAYSRSSGKASPLYDAWECGECGSTYLGRDSAEHCCTEDDAENFFEEGEDDE
jgi:hypothetical protein